MNLHIWNNKDKMKAEPEKYDEHLKNSMIESGG